VRLDLLLIRRHPELSRRKARDVIEKGQVSVAGERVREPGRDVDETVAVSFDPNLKALPRARSTLRVLFRDEHVLVLDKPAGLLSVPTAPGLDEDTALARAKDYARRLDPRGGYAERVHRLDRDTTGALAFALSREARARLIEAFRGHRIERRYLALVAGQPEAEQGTIDAPLRDKWLSGRRGVARPGDAARNARTHWRVRERLPGATLLEVRLETGRQHQVRVHLSHAGLPILGDPVYGPPAGGRPLARRPMLHAAHLAFAHPITGAPVEATSPLPPDFESVLKALRQGKLQIDVKRSEPARRTGVAPGTGGARATGGARGGRAPSSKRRRKQG
jgi:23S rRNA pseudouridine1911/1915/1917 synthase